MAYLGIRQTKALSNCVSRDTESMSAESFCTARPTDALFGRAGWLLQGRAAVSPMPGRAFRERDHTPTDTRVTQGQTSVPDQLDSMGTKSSSVPLTSSHHSCPAKCGVFYCLPNSSKAETAYCSWYQQLNRGTLTASNQSSMLRRLSLGLLASAISIAIDGSWLAWLLRWIAFSADGD